MTRKKPFGSETELAALVVEWLRADGWDVFQEAEVPGRGGAADIVAVRSGRVWIVEAKLVFGMDVMEQAWDGRRAANWVSVAVPSAVAPGRLGFRIRMCGMLGIGVLSVEPGVCGVRPVVRVVVDPVLNRRADTRKTRNGLLPEMRHYAPAGNNWSGRWTPFKATVRALLDVVTAEPGIQVREAVKRIKDQHHYSSDSAARSSLVTWTREGKVPGIKVREVDGRLCFYPVPGSREELIGSHPGDWNHGNGTAGEAGGTAGAGAQTGARAGGAGHGDHGDEHDE